MLGHFRTQYAGVGNQRPRPFAGFPPRLCILDGKAQQAGAFISRGELTAENVQDPFAGSPYGRRPLNMKRDHRLNHETIVVALRREFCRGETRFGMTAKRAALSRSRGPSPLPDYASRRGTPPRPPQ